MAEVHPNQKQYWLAGIPREPELIARELYRLLAIFAASQSLANRRTGMDEACVYASSIKNFERAEIGRILVSVAAMLRNDWDANGSAEIAVSGQLAQGKMVHPVGTLVEDTDLPGNERPLALRNSFNKILHAQSIHLDRSDPTSHLTGHLEPRVHLYGEYNERSWKATLEIFAWAEMIHLIF